MVEPIETWTVTESDVLDDMENRNTKLYLNFWRIQQYLYFILYKYTK